MRVDDGKVKQPAEKIAKHTGNAQLAKSHTDDTLEAQKKAADKAFDENTQRQSDDSKKPLIEANSVTISGLTCTNKNRMCV